jgi:hypothetical protein
MAQQAVRDGRPCGVRALAGATALPPCPPLSHIVISDHTMMKKEVALVVVW